MPQDSSPTSDCATRPCTSETSALSPDSLPAYLSMPSRLTLKPSAMSVLFVVGQVAEVGVTRPRIGSVVDGEAVPQHRRLVAVGVRAAGPHLLAQLLDGHAHDLGLCLEHLVQHGGVVADVLLDDPRLLPRGG